MKKKDTPTQQELQKQCKEYSEVFGFENPMKNSNARCNTCGSTNVSVIGFCYDCGEVNEQV